MNLPESWHVLIQQVKETDTIQWLAVSLGMAEVLLARANKIWLYPTGIAATLLSIYVLLVAGLYAECLLNGYYVVMSVYGWWYWVKKKNKPPVKISRCSSRDWLVTAAIVILGFLLLFLSLRHFTNSTVPVWDAWVSATAWAGMWLLAKRKVENWLLLNVSNLFAIPLLYYKQLPMFAALTLFLFIIALFGYYEWAQRLRKEKKLQYETTGTPR